MNGPREKCFLTGPVVAMVFRVYVGCSVSPHQRQVDEALAGVGGCHLAGLAGAENSRALAIGSGDDHVFGSRS